jgi:N-acetylglucosaminyldiphosphoundecaprenol N-acetyl-beta-D-mannosaminyltransferase
MGKAETILGSRIDATSYEDACDRIQTWAEAKKSCYIVAANVHVVMTAYWQRDYQQVINNAALVTPDGMPLVWGLRWLGVKHQSRVYGPDLMIAWCDRAAKLGGLPIYLYGSSPETLAQLEINLKDRFEHLAIAGSYSPPFAEFTAEAIALDLERIRASGAAVVFVGLGCPKQEYWMSQAQGKLNMVMIGVGAAFDFAGGQISQAPHWMMQMGLEWLYRLCQEPIRLWRRYLINNPMFAILFGWQLLKRLFKP